MLGQGVLKVGTPCVELMIRQAFEQKPADGWIGIGGEIAER
jgi:hypothetical protein